LLIAFMHNDYRYAFLFGGIAYLLTPLFLWAMLRERYPFPGFPTSMHPDGLRGKAEETELAPELAATSSNQ
jgi:hypothetical protein